LKKTISLGGECSQTSIFGLVGWIDFIVGGLAIVISLVQTNWVGALLGFGIACHGAAWEEVDKKFGTDRD